MVAGTEPDAAQMLGEIQHQRERLNLARDKYREYKAEAKDKLKGLKEAVDAAWQELDDLIRESKEGIGPLFPRNGTNGEAPAPARSMILPPGTADDQSWREVKLHTLKISEALLKILEKADLHTIGDLQRFVQEKSGHGHTDPIATIKGIGPAKAEQITAALDAFWRTWTPKTNGQAEPATKPIDQLRVATPITQLDLPAKSGGKIIKALTAAGFMLVEQLEAAAAGIGLEEYLKSVKGLEEWAGAVAQAVAALRGAKDGEAKE